MPLNTYERAHRYSPPPSAAAGGASTPTATVPTQKSILEAEKDLALDGPIVAVEWSSDGPIPPLDWEVQWGYRWSGGWLTARPYRLETMLEDTEVVVIGSGKSGINDKMKWQAQIAVQRLARKSGGDPAKDSCVVRVRALGVTGWGKWSDSSAALTPQVLLPPNPLDN